MKIETSEKRARIEKKNRIKLTAGAIVRYYVFLTTDTIGAAVK